MQAWLKGGLRASVISFVGIIVQTIFINFIHPLSNISILSGFSVPLLFGYALAPTFSDCTVSIKPDINTCTLIQQIPGFIIGLIIIILVYFLLGCLVGWIVGKIKA